MQSLKGYRKHIAHGGNPRRESGTWRGFLAMFHSHKDRV